MNRDVFFKNMLVFVMALVPAYLSTVIFISLFGIDIQNKSIFWYEGEAKIISCSDIHTKKKSSVYISFELEGKASEANIYKAKFLCEDYPKELSYFKIAFWGSRTLFFQINDMVVLNEKDGISMLNMEKGGMIFFCVILYISILFFKSKRLARYF